MRLYGTLALLAVTAAVWSNEGIPPAPYTGKQLVQEIGPFVDDSTLGVLHLDLAHANPTEVKVRLAALTKMAAPPWQGTLDQVAEVRNNLRNAGVRSIYFVLNATDFNSSPLVVVSSEGLNRPGTRDLVAGLFPGDLTPLHGCYVCGNPAQLKALQARKGDAPAALLADLTAAFEAGEKAPVRLALVLSPAQRRIVAENLPEVPVVGSTKALTEGLRWASLAFAGNAEQGLKLRLHVEASDAEAAGKLAKLAEAGLVAVTQTREAQAIPALQDLLKLVVLKAAGKSLTVTLDDTALATAVVPTLARVQVAAGAMRDTNSLKQLGIAMHNHLDQHKGRFPAAALTDNQGQPLLSWRVHILPYIEQTQLYKRFKLDEPWDSEHNKKLIKEMPALYRTSLAPKLAAEGKTTWVVPVGPDTIFPPGKPVRIAEITDGTSNTILLTEIDPANAIPWTKPDDLVVDLKKPLAGIALDGDDTFKALFADGSVRRIKKTIDPKTLAALFTRNGGEVIGGDQ